MLGIVRHLRRRGQNQRCLRIRRNGLKSVIERPTAQPRGIRWHGDRTGVETT